MSEVYINEKAYETMIQELYTFRNQLTIKNSELHTIAYQASSCLNGDDDAQTAMKALAGICSRLTDCGNVAVSIAGMMYEELNRYLNARRTDTDGEE